MKGIRIAFLAAAIAAAITAARTPAVLHAAIQQPAAQQPAAQQQPPATQNPVVGAETSQPTKTQAPGPDPGAAVYAKRCAICHGTNREGSLPAFPPVQGITHRYSNDQLTALIHTGKGRMPGFPKLQGDDLNNLLQFLASAPSSPESSSAGSAQPSPELTAGEGLFHQNCAFCHGRDAMGGETGPDLTQSKLVLGDKNGDKIGPVVHEGRPDTKMPGFNFSTQEMASLVAFIHARVKAAEAHAGGRRGVVPEDLQTGNAQAGKAYFEGPGGCAKCHSATGDLAGIARRFQGLQLEERMLYPRNSRSEVTVTTPTGKTFTGTLAYRDEFTIGLRDESGTYRSWPTRLVKFTVKSPADAHIDQLPKYSDDDIHNLMKYLQTLR
ncbi:MAG TPA: c-type cytochrome [Terracidiphilus sp.]